MQVRQGGRINTTTCNGHTSKGCVHAMHTTVLTRKGRTTRLVLVELYRLISCEGDPLTDAT